MGRTAPFGLAALVFLLCACGSPGSRQGLREDAPAGRPVAPPSLTRLGGRPLASLDSWDIVHPRFSPAGDRLAFAKVEVEDGTETTELALLDLATGAVTTLLDPQEAKKQVREQAPSEVGDNPLFAFDGRRPQRVLDFEELYDFDMTPDRRLAVFCAWRGERRILDVRKLRD